MPLYKRTPFSLLEPPKDVDPHEHVFQVRFTKEIFKDYQDYLNRLNLYRQRVWTCKVTGKTNLTYEEALVSEHRATEKVQQIPEEFMVPVLHMIQYSTLTLKELVDTIYTKTQGYLFEGAELYGKKDESLYACKIMKKIEDSDTVLYEVGWLDKNKNVIGTSTVNADSLVHRKAPFSRSVLKSFIRESTSHSSPWVVHEKLAQKHRLLTEPPKDFKDKNGSLKGSNDEGRKSVQDSEGKRACKKRKNADQDNSAGLEDKMKKSRKEEKATVPIRYPIDDLSVESGADDPVFTNRPSPSRDFKVPMDCVGDLLMVWDFCSSFSRLLSLYPFSLEDFEKAICHKDSGLILVVETHSALLRLLIKDEGEYFLVVQKKKRKSKITLSNWAEYLCDFLEIEDKPELSGHLGTIKRGHYGLLNVHAKLGILCELVAEVLTTDSIRQKLDEYVGQQQALSAAKREEARRKKEESGTTETNQRNVLENGAGNLHTPKSKSNHRQDKGVLLNGNGNISQSAEKHNFQNGEAKLELCSRKPAKKLSENGSVTEHKANLSKIDESKRTKQNKKDQDKEKKIEERRKEHLERERERKFICTNPLGKDRDYNRYWFFRCDGRIFIESSDSNQWGYYTSKEELDAFMSSLNPKGERERALKRQLEKQYVRLSLALQKRSKHITQRILMEEAVLRRSTRVRAQPRDNSAMAFQKYINKWKD